MSKRSDCDDGESTSSEDEKAFILSSSNSQIYDNSYVQNQSIGIKRARGDYDNYIESVSTTNGKSVIVWTPQLDEFLKEAVHIHGRKWKKVSEFVNDQISAILNGSTSAVNASRDQCSLRWKCFLDPETQNCTKGPWSEEEKSLLESLVGEYAPEDGPVKLKSDVVSWTSIARRINRSEADVTQQWTQMRAQGLKKGNFTADEDQYIVQRVREWNAAHKGVGLWVQLEKELGRKDKRISERWRNILCKRPDVKLYMSADLMAGNVNCSGGSGSMARKPSYQEAYLQQHEVVSLSGDSHAYSAPPHQQHLPIPGCASEPIVSVRDSQPAHFSYNPANDVSSDSEED